MMFDEKAFFEREYPPHTYGLFGWPVAHSVSPEIHSLLFAESGIDARYYAFAVPPERIDAALAHARGTLAGFNCTIPHKQAAMRALDAQTDDARLIGASNTIAVRAGQLTGHNTDIHGFAKALSLDGCTLSGQRVLLLGNGGVARMIAFHALREGAQLTIAGRDTARAAALAQSVCQSVGYPAHQVSIGTLDTVQGSFDVVINGTPVGMWPQQNAAPVDLSRLQGISYVYDTIYNPQTTQLLRTAAKRGIRTQNGLAMLVLQAAYAQTFWTGHVFDDAALTRVIDRAVYILAKRRLHNARQRKNIILTGFMGSGKSTVGRLLAAQMGMDFFDMDTELERRAGMPITELFTARGEAAFRAMEAALCTELSAHENCVIATGGGVPVSPQNRDALGRAGTVVFLNPPLSFILDNTARDRTRPLLLGSDRAARAQALLGDRLPLYRAGADVEINITGEPAARAAQIAREI